MTAKDNLLEGNVHSALTELQAEVRAAPADAKLRIFLFQLLSIVGQWDRALVQLNVAAELDPAALAMREVFQAALRCEVLRAQVFEGKRSPMVLGQPEQWLAYLIQALMLAGLGESENAKQVRAKAFEEASESSGIIDGEKFSWIADTDVRFGPVLEAIMNRQYYWIPITALTEVTMEQPTDLRDLVWMPAQLRLANGGATVALIPTRYPGSETSADNQILLARKTIWEEKGSDVVFGLGQRMLATNVGENALMDVRSIHIDALEPASR
jgi:type VI secretion system protein ImpE